MVKSVSVQLQTAYILNKMKNHRVFYHNIIRLSIIEISI